MSTDAHQPDAASQPHNQGYVQACQHIKAGLMDKLRRKIEEGATYSRDELALDVMTTIDGLMINRLEDMGIDRATALSKW